MADTVSTGSATTGKIDDHASEIIEQRRASERYMQNNYYPEWAEIYRNMKARVQPILVKNEKGEEVEDTSRSNVCLPDHFVMHRHGVARLTRNSPNLRLRGKVQDAADKFAAQLMWQWDRSESQKAFRRIVSCARAFGWGVGKSYYDKVVVTRDFRRLTAKLSMADLLRLQGAGEDEVNAAESEGSIPNEAQIAQAIAQFGDSTIIPTAITKYEGAKLDYVFSGDVFLEPGFRSLNESAYVIENNIRDEQWLEYWTKQTTTDPDTGEERPVIDPKKAQEVLETAGDRNYIDEKSISLRRAMREAINVSDPRTAGKPIKPPRKRFLVDERHSIINGRLCIEYVGEENIMLGYQWYPWNTYGRYIHTELVLIPDMIEGIGDSTLRISRFLMQLRNARANQTTDFINNKLLPLLKTLEGGDVTKKKIIRTAFARLLQVRSMGEYEFLEDPAFPAEALQDQAQWIREMQQVEPGMNDFQPGTETVPQSGRLATTALLQKQGADAVLADELNNLGQFIRETMELWMYFNQQAMEDSIEISSEDNPKIKRIIEGLSQNTQGGNPRTIRIDPMDIQEEFEILPEEGSTLANDDAYKTQRLLQLFQVAEGNPDVFNKKAIGAALLQAFPVVSIEEGLAPDAPPSGPPVKIGFNVTAKFEELPGDVQAKILEMGGLPTEGTLASATVKHVADAVEHVGRAADAAAKLVQPAHEPRQPSVPGMGKGKNVGPKQP